MSSGEPTLEKFVSWKARPQRPPRAAKLPLEVKQAKSWYRRFVVIGYLGPLVFGDWQVRRRSLLEALCYVSSDVLRSCSTLFESRPL